MENPAFFETVDRSRGDIPLIILDEIHKYKDWKNYLKGTYDGYSGAYRFLVTGSGRLDVYQRRGDSLAGRYWQFHLLPFTMGEMFSSKPGVEDLISRLTDLPAPGAGGIEESWETLSRCSGFPEPFLSGETRHYRRWAAGYHRQVLREDIRDAFAVKQIDTMEALYSLLPSRVGSSFSASNCADLLKVSHTTISSWIEVSKRFYLVFGIRPYTSRIARSLVKEPKLYLYDPLRIEDEGARFENMVALELHRAATLWTDYGSGGFDLWYLRTKEKKEVDFLVTLDGKPLFLVEAKLSETEPGRALRDFQDILKVPAIQLVNRPGIARILKNGANRVLIVTASRWLAALG